MLKIRIHDEITFKVHDHNNLYLLENITICGKVN